MLKIDRNLYVRSDVKELIDYLNEKPVTKVEIHRINFTTTKMNLVSFMSIEVETYDKNVETFLVTGLHPHNADVLEQNINEWMKDKPEPRDPFLESLYTFLESQGYTELALADDTQEDYRGHKEYIFDGFLDGNMEIKIVVHGHYASLYDRYVSDKHFVFHAEHDLRRYGGKTE